MSEISKGMVVQLISGGPQMSVVSVGDHEDIGGPKEAVTCVWFDEKHVKHEDVFDAAVIKEYEPMRRTPRR